MPASPLSLLPFQSHEIVSQECIEGTISNLVQTWTTWTQGDDETDLILMVNGNCDLT